MAQSVKHQHVFAVEIDRAFESLAISDAVRPPDSYVYRLAGSFPRTR